MYGLGIAQDQSSVMSQVAKASEAVEQDALRGLVCAALILIVRSEKVSSKTKEERAARAAGTSSFIHRARVLREP